MERKLAAIFSTDVKGYSRLMGDDEEATIRTLTSYRSVISTLIQQYRGRVIDALVRDAHPLEGRIDLGRWILFRRHSRLVGIVSRFPADRGAGDGAQASAGPASSPYSRKAGR